MASTNEIVVSGCIRFEEGSMFRSGRDTGCYRVRSPHGFGVGIPTEHINPEDLRAMADHLERQRASRTRTSAAFEPTPGDEGW